MAALADRATILGDAARQASSKSRLRTSSPRCVTKDLSEDLALQLLERVETAENLLGIGILRFAGRAGNVVENR